jgi:hypothetical protein
LEYGGPYFVSGTGSKSGKKRRSRIWRKIRLKTLVLWKRGREFGDLVLKEAEKGGRKSGT